MAAIRRVIVYVGSSFVAFATWMIGLKVLASYPIAGVLLILAAMSLSLYGIAGLCGAQWRRERNDTLDTD